MMSIRIRSVCASLAAAALLLPAVAGAAGEGKKFTRADFERCNQQAMQIAGIETGSPAALPGAAQQPSQPSAQPGAGGTGMPGTTSSGTGTGTTGAGTGVTSGTTGTTGSGTGMGVGAADQELERIVQAYRDCLQQAHGN
jgi:hypothetical protein